MKVNNIYYYDDDDDDVIRFICTKIGPYKIPLHSCRKKIIK